MPKVLLVSSKGGHFDELCQITLGDDYDKTYVVEQCCTTKPVDYFLFAGTRSNMLKYPFVLLINTFKAIKILNQVKPDLIISTGAHSCVPFFYLSRAKKIYIESFAVINNQSLTYKLIKNRADQVIVQHKQAQDNYEGAKYFGGVY